jgi:branched-chain amino acid aminotransferase
VSRDAPQRRIWLDGALVPWEQATVHVLSHSLQRGSLIFDYMGVHETARGPAIFRMPEHLERLRRSAELVGLPLDRDAGALGRAIVETVRANPGARAVKISAYLPSIEVDVVPQDPHVAVAIAAYDPIRDIVLPKGGAPPYRPTLRLRVERQRRNRRDDILPPQAKAAAQYLSPMAAKWAARRAGYDEVLLLDADGCVAEGPTTNLFWVDARGTLHTPPEDRVLHGITRLSILEIAKHDGLPAVESRVRPEEVMAAAEAFVTGTTAGVWPVESIDDQPLEGGAPGPITGRLRERLGCVVRGEDPDFESWLTPV